MGIATAFGAPSGGLLFAFEELANSFSQALGWQTFFACTLAVLTLDTFKSAQHSLKEGHFGVFDGDASTVFFEVGIPIAHAKFSHLPQFMDLNPAGKLVLCNSAAFLAFCIFAPMMLGIAASRGSWSCAWRFSTCINPQSGLRVSLNPKSNIDTSRLAIILQNNETCCCTGVDAAD